MWNYAALAACVLVTPVFAQTTPSVFYYGGDKTPDQSPYGGWFTTVGPGHPTGSYFVGTTWSSDGNVLMMRTEHPNDYPGASSKGIWFGRTGGYGDPSVGMSLAPTAAGNRVDARLALGPASSEWSLYWYDDSGYGAGFYFLNNGVSIGLAAGSRFIPLDMTSFRTFSAHLHDGQVAYFLDGALLETGNAYTGISNFLLLGDGSATDVSGYGTLLVDSLTITTSAGPIIVPEPGTAGLRLCGLLFMAVTGRGRRETCR